MRQITQFHLGPSMYAPATHDIATLVAIANGSKFSGSRSIIFCTEDAVLEKDLPIALHNLKHAMKRFIPGQGPLRFIRVRTPLVLGTLLQMRGIENIDGFVLPKVTASTLPYYLASMGDHDRFYLMPTLETAEIFDPSETKELLKQLERNERIRRRILCLRIGGNDLLQVLEVDRDPNLTIYDTGIGSLIERLVHQFKPRGFGLTAPVYGEFGEQYLPVLEKEVRLDLQKGLFGKTAIHPAQLPIIERCYAVTSKSLDRAQRILEEDAEAVFKVDDRMCEPATHRAAARVTIQRAEIYGVID